MNRVEQAKDIAIKAHYGQTRRDKVTPYIRHVEDVVRRIISSDHSEDIIILAWLHDVLEDCNTPEIEQELNQFLNSSERSFLHLLTKNKNQSYEFYIRNIIPYYPTKTIKLADILSNLSDSPTPEQITKYTKALAILLRLE